MAISVSIVKRSGVLPAGRAVIADVTFDSSYPAGGEPYTAAMFGLSKIDFMQTQMAKASSTTANVCMADHTASTLMLFSSNGAAPAALLETSTVNQSATVARVIAYELTNV
jgi:hypothetical protein